MPARSRCAAALAALVTCAVPAACGGGDGPDAGEFCAEVRADPAAITNPLLATPADVDATLDHYRRLGELAPAEVSEDWEALVVNLETASTVVPEDPESVQRAVAQAYATEGAAVEVRTWLLERCQIDLGPVTTIAPQGPATPATLPPSTDPTATTAVLTTEPAG